MLRRLLRVIANGGLGNTAELATALDVSSGLVEAMIGELDRRGLVQRAGATGAGCDGCPMERNCGPRARAAAWLLTTAGRRHVQA